MSDAHLSLTGFDIAGIERLQNARPEPRVRLQSRASSALEQGRSRLVVLSALFALAFGAVGLKLVGATVLTGGDDPVTARTALRAPHAGRADIVDRNGVLLATSLTTQSAYADPKLILDAREAAVKLASVLPDLDPKAMEAELRQDRRFIWIRRNLTPKQQYEINRLGIPGVFFQKEERRIYPQGNLAAHVVGFTGIDNAGLMGIEQSYDSRLKQMDGPLQLSIDVRLQHLLRQELAATMEEFSAIGAAGMVMDVKTGEILGMVSLPDFDPHSPPPPQPEQDLDPRFNRNTLGVYEMGSTFKIFNTALALESGKVRLRDSFDTTHPIRIGRFTITDSHPENKWMDVAEIFEVSSNIGSVRMVEQVGPDAQKEFMTRLGMTRPVSLEIPETGWPMVPNPWREVNMMTIAFGHGMSVSPLHTVTAAAGVVNGGIMHPATLLKRDRGAPVPGTRIISESTSDTLRKLLRLVVTNGTGRMANTPGYVVGGKTGTAEKVKNGGYARKALISSFLGTFPMNDPRYAVYVLVDEPKGTKKSYGFATGGWVGAPTVGRIIGRIGPLLGIRPVDAQSPEIVQALAINPQQAKPLSQVAANPGGGTR